MSSQQIIMNPIGYVRTDAVGDEVKDRTRTSQIVLDPKLVEALDGIEGFSHIFVLFWLNQVNGQNSALKLHPRGRKDMPLLGVFALRTSLRPNPIGLTLAELTSVKVNVLTVRGLDAYNGTPVLDIKPFDSWDAARDAMVPDWWVRLDQKNR